MSAVDETVVAAAPRVLVLMAAYGGQRWIAEQLGSILAQRGVAVRVRVSDDRSHDGTADVVRELAGRDDRVSLVVRAESSGSAGANFRSLLADADLSAADFVALSDQDDVWDSDHLVRGCEALRARRGAGGYSCAVRTFGAGRASTLSQCGRARSLDHLFEGAGQGCSFVLTAELARRVQAACRDLPAAVAALHYHDWLIYVIARGASLDWIFDPRPGVSYRQHGANEIGARSGAGAIRRRLRMIRSGWYKSQVRAASTIVRALGSLTPAHARFDELFLAPPSLLRRLRLAARLAFDGRRRLVDRGVLVWAALAGWL
ncbi:MAG TPA: glycosyltransferase [Burkholderiaceae bacterium]